MAAQDSDKEKRGRGRGSSGLPLLTKNLFKGLFAPFTVRVRAGPLAGRRWSPASGIRFIRGDFKREKMEAIARGVPEGAVFYDIGAHVGYTTVLAADRVGPEGLVVAFEPRPLNLRFLRIHVEVNGLENVRIVPSAVAARSGEARFDADHGSGTGRLDDAGTMSVPVRTLDELVESGELPAPDFIKIDVEGGELSVLEGGRKLLRAHAPVLFLATHGHAVHHGCIEILREAGYEWEVLSVGREPGDGELLARVPGRGSLLGQKEPEEQVEDQAGEGGGDDR